MLHLLAALGALWRIPDRLQTGRASIAGEGLAAANWEISWALHRAGITELWVLRAGTVGFLAWRWLRHMAEREDLRLVLMVSGEPPGPEQAAALRGCHVQLLDPDRLGRPRARPSPPWWQTPSFCAQNYGDRPKGHRTGRPSEAERSGHGRGVRE